MTYLERAPLIGSKPPDMLTFELLGEFRLTVSKDENNGNERAYL